MCRKIFSAQADSILIVKVLAITMVVVNHAYGDQSFHGGLNGLMLISGLTMATFSLGGSTQDTLRAFWNFGVRLAVPSFILALMWAIAYWEFRWPELLFFNNWLTKHRLVSFPIWYPQVMIQMLMFLGLLFWCLDLTTKIQKRPQIVTSVLLAVALISNLLSYSFWDTAYLQDKLPHLLAWNFLLGWFIWSFKQYENSLLRKLMLSFVSLACSFLAFVYTEALYGDVRFFVFSFFVLVVIWFDEIFVPNWMAHVLNLVGQSTFYIFLWHYPAFQVQTTLAEIARMPDAAFAPWAMAIAGVVYPTLLWVGVTALRRAYRKLGGFPVLIVAK